MRFEWDETKNRSNQRKHGISFEEAAQVFLDPFHVSIQDRTEDGERRWQTFGLSAGFALLVVAHTTVEYDDNDEAVESSESFRQDAPIERKGEAMKKKMVSYTPETLPPLTDEQRTHLKVMAGRPDSEIDYSDIPPLTEEMLKKAVRGRFYKPTKRQITARVDADVLEWLKSQGKGYQSRINAILRREMLSSLK